MQLIRGRRVAWSILGALGALDPGSNPGDPTFCCFLNLEKFNTRTIKELVLNPNSEEDEDMKPYKRTAYVLSFSLSQYPLKK